MLSLKNIFIEAKAYSPDFIKERTGINFFSIIMQQINNKKEL
jgi:hypothetical protein